MKINFKLCAIIILVIIFKKNEDTKCANIPLLKTYDRLEPIIIGVIRKPFCNNNIYRVKFSPRNLLFGKFYVFCRITLSSNAEMFFNDLFYHPKYMK